VEEAVPKIQYLAKERNGWDDLPGVIDVQHRAACVAVNFALHVAAQRRAVVLKILHFHGVSSF